MSYTDGKFTLAKDKALEPINNDIASDIRVNFLTKIAKTKDGFVEAYPKNWGDKMYNCMFSTRLRHEFKRDLPWWAELNSGDGFQFSGFDPDTIPNSRDNIWKGMSIYVAEKNVNIRMSKVRPFPNANKVEITGTTTVINHNAPCIACNFMDERWDWLKEEYKKYMMPILVIESYRDILADCLNKAATFKAINTMDKLVHHCPPLWILAPREYKIRRPRESSLDYAPYKQPDYMGKNPEIKKVIEDFVSVALYVKMHT